MTRWRIWTRNGPGQPWYDPVRDEDGGPYSWESAEDAEATAQQFRIRDAAGVPELAAEQLGIDPSELSPRSIEVIVLPDGEQPEDSLQVQTLADGQQIPLPRRREFDQFVRRVAPPAGRKRPGETDQPRERFD